MSKIRFFITLLLLTTTAAFAQKQMSYRSPVDFSMTLAGNFGEIRAGHFHAGIDVKALRGVGSPIFAVEEGYVSRISVSPTGYGNMMMITHPDGTHSLYAHLDDFAPKYRDYIERVQLSSKRYKVDRYIEKGKFPVNKGDVIATMGNTGSSAGPHLHFEFRHAATSNTVNPLHFANYVVADRVAPSVHRVFVYQRDTVILGVPVFSLLDTRETVVISDGNLTLEGGTLQVNKPFYLAYEVIDYKDGRTNTMGITGMTQSVDGQTNFGFNINEIPFGTTRYINTFTQYDQNRASRYHVMRAYRSQNNPLHLYQGVVNRGLVGVPAQGETLEMKSVFWDDNENKTTLVFSVETSSEGPKKHVISPTDRIAYCNMPFAYSDSIFSLEMEPNTLYESTFLPIYHQNGEFVVGESSVPLQKYYNLAIEQGVNPALRSKALLVTQSSKGLSSQGGEWKDGALRARLRSFGRFKIAYDTIAPTITPQQTEGVVSAKTLRFKIADNLSGVASYNIYVDDKWVIGAFDPRILTLWYELERDGTPRERNVRVEVSDYKGNKTTIKETYKW